MTLPRVHDEHACLASGCKHLPARPHRCIQARHIIAECRAEPARQQKIPLHVDDDEGGPLDIHGERRRLRRYGPQCQGPIPLDQLRC